MNTETPKNQNGKVALKSLLSKKEIIIIFMFFVAVLSILLYTFFSPNYYYEKAPLYFEIKSGENFNSVIQNLHERNVIPSKTNFKILAVIYGADKKIKAGRYQIPNGLNYIKLLDLLINGYREVPLLVTIPEGSSINQIAGIFQRNLKSDSVKIVDLANNKKFLDSLGIKSNSMEGYLLPESFFFYENISEENILIRLNSELNRILKVDSVQNKIKNSKYSLHEILTIASIVEGESNKPDEFRDIAGVYYNRLKTGMKLQADPTVQFIIKDKWRRLLNKDLLIDSPYNTYLYEGLPPGPINNPGKDAILAAVFPNENEYFYFVADGKGGHIFTRNYSEHLREVEKYRKWVREERKKLKK